jgi:hypothetical protein
MHHASTSAHSLFFNIQQLSFVTSSRPGCMGATYKTPVKSTGKNYTLRIEATVNSLSSD